MEKYIFSENSVKAEFLVTGDLVSLTAADMMINQLDGQSLDGSLVQLYLRVYDGKEIIARPMIGSNADSFFSADAKGAYWTGNFAGVNYQVAFTLNSKGIWYWTIELAGTGKIIDILYGQDLGNASRGAVQSNEAYISQYLDHKINQTERGYVISSRQNQPQNGFFPAVEQGSLTKNIGFSTDGYQFFGREFKKNNHPVVLDKSFLANEVYQYEFAYTALQSEKETLTEKNTKIIFYGITKATQETGIEGPLYEQQMIADAYRPVVFPKAAGKNVKKSFGEVLTGAVLTSQELEKLFPNKKLVEEKDGNLLSFFDENNHHIVLQEKELLQERATGQILLSGMDLTVDKPPMATTIYMYGIFNSQIVLGNTSMNKLMSNSRNSLNVQKSSGQRIYLKEGERWRYLGMPSAFEMGLNSATWYYKMLDDLLIITTYTVANDHEIRMTFKSQRGQKYIVAITNHLLMSGDENPHAVLEQQDKRLKITADADSIIQAEYPELVYYMTLDQEFTLTNESIFGVEDQRLVTLAMAEVDSFKLTIQGSLTGEAFKELETELEIEDRIFSNFIDELINGFKLSSKTVEVESMNTLIRWYTHNMLVHYLSPHGLEQYGGAAWGTRDVSQGPTEFFLTMDRPEIVKNIIEKIFANQFSDDGNWPQWFMFDRYEKQKADESHGDVIVWPLKVVADYLAKTDDKEILEMLIPYTIRDTFLKTTEKYSLFDHLRKEIRYIEDHFLAGTFLSCYGDGDWDDTLQPYDSRLKKNMASSWTVALTYQVLEELSKSLETVDKEFAEHLLDLSQKVKADFEKYMFATDVIPGFVYLEEGKEPELMIHPTDKVIGIKYRLLPMTRSMIAGLLPPEDAESHYQLIKKHLYFPDGVRLMSKPANYQGGVSVRFKRAEQAANFGREIGLQYVHAHIRFTEAMAKLGKNDETWRALQTVNPIQIKKRVSNAAVRQSNVYFSSSDGDFKTRYEAQANFGKLEEGIVAVKGGWRIYSSGPGIYINQLISNVLGIRKMADTITIDPVLPIDFDGSTLELMIAEKLVTLEYHLGAERQTVIIDGEKVAFIEEENPYRQGGMMISLSEIKKKVKTGSKIDIYR